MAAHGTMSGSDRERLRQEWMQHSAQALERMFAQEQQAGLIPFTQREDRELVSRAGTVRLERERYRCTTCRVVFFPLDQKLELSAEGYSPRVLAKRVRQGGKSASFADT